MKKLNRKINITLVLIAIIYISCFAYLIIYHYIILAFLYATIIGSIFGLFCAWLVQKKSNLQKEVNFYNKSKGF